MLDWLENTWKTIYGYITATVTSMFPLLYVILLVIAGCLGSMLYGKIKPANRDVYLRALGIGALLMGASELWDGFFVLQTGQFEAAGTLLVAVSLLLGYVFGSALRPERGLGRLGVSMYGRFVKPPKATVGDVSTIPAKSLKENNPPSAEGFLLATLLTACSGSSLCYAIADEASDPIPLLVKLGFCFAVILLLGAVYGANVTFAVVPVAVVEGIMLLVNSFWGHLLTPTLLNQFMLIGGVILISTGLSLCLGKKIRAAHFIPAYFIPVIYGLALLLVEKLMETE